MLNSVAIGKINRLGQSVRLKSAIFALGWDATDGTERMYFYQEV